MRRPATGRRIWRPQTDLWTDAAGIAGSMVETFMWHLLSQRQISELT
jgi:hypothetical protein